jgi:hypothetical protein
MIRVVFFDLGLTLVDSQQRPLPHVKEALQIVQSFTDARGRPLALGLVSDFEMPEPPSTLAKIASIFDRYLAILDGTGLRPFFEPVEKRVTLSTHANALKPDRKVFATALKRLGLKVSLKECLFITENHEHVQAARTKLKMSALQFRSESSPEFDFEDWLQAPPMIAHLVTQKGGANSETALSAHLRLAHGFDMQAADQSKSAHMANVRGTIWKPLGEAAGGDLANVHMPFAVDGKVTRGPAGDIRKVTLTEPTAGDVNEAAVLARSLAQHGQIEGWPAGPGGAATHRIETDDQGRRKLVRKRFRAV